MAQKKLIWDEMNGKIGSDLSETVKKESGICETTGPVTPELKERAESWESQKFQFWIMAVPLTALGTLVGKGGKGGVCLGDRIWGLL